MLPTLTMIQGLLHGFQTGFNPPLEGSNLEAVSATTLQPAIHLLASQSESSSLFPYAPNLLEDVISTYSELKSTDYRTMLELMVRVGMNGRPEYFEGIKNEVADNRPLSKLMN